MSLLPPVKVGKLQAALHTKAKNSPDYRFYALYDKIYRWDGTAFTALVGGSTGPTTFTFIDDGAAFVTPAQAPPAEIRPLSPGALSKWTPIARRSWA